MARERHSREPRSHLKKIAKERTENKATPRSQEFSERSYRKLLQDLRKIAKVSHNRDHIER